MQAKAGAFAYTCEKSPPNDVEDSQREPLTMRSMQALVKRERGPGLWLEEIPIPTVGEFDVLVRVLRSSICGTDIHIYEWDSWAQRTIPTPMAIGHVPWMCTTAASLPSTFVGSTEIFSAAVRSHGEESAGTGRSLPTATPACCDTLIHGLFALTRHGTMPVPTFEMRTSTGVADWPGRTFTSTIGRSTESCGCPSTDARSDRVGLRGRVGVLRLRRRDVHLRVRVLEVLQVERRAPVRVVEVGQRHRRPPPTAACPCTDRRMRRRSRTPAPGTGRGCGCGRGRRSRRRSCTACAARRRRPGRAGGCCGSRRGR